jgi:hypothetical protein
MTEESRRSIGAGETESLRPLAHRLKGKPAGRGDNFAPIIVFGQGRNHNNRIQPVGKPLGP